MSVEEKGPYQVGQSDYEMGEIVIQPTDGVFETITAPIRGMITWPEQLPENSLVPFIVLAHGRHSEDVENFRGLGYIARHLSSHGYACASIDLNAVVGPQGTMVSKKPVIVVGGAIEHRARIILRTIVALREHPKLKGLANFRSVGLIGHSRGGEAVCRAGAEDDEAGGIFGIKAVFSLAPVDFTGVRLSKPLFLISGNLDADVSDGQSIRIWDRAVGQRAGLYVSGAIHNYFSDNWENEWDQSDPAFPTAGPKILSRDTHEKIAKSYCAAFFEMNLRRKGGYEKLLRGTEKFAALGHVQFERLLAAPEQVVIDNFEGPFDPDYNTLGGVCLTQGQILVRELDLERVRVDDTAFKAAIKEVQRWKGYHEQPLADDIKRYVQEKLALASTSALEILSYFLGTCEPQELDEAVKLLVKIDPSFVMSAGGWESFKKHLESEVVTQAALDDVALFLASHSHAGHAFNHLRKGLLITWNGKDAVYTSGFQPIDVTQMGWLQLRIGQTYAANMDPLSNSVGMGQNMSVRLTDNNGGSATIVAGEVDGDIAAPWLDQATFKTNMRTLLLPLLEFTSSGVNLSAITEVALLFNITSPGTVAIDDISFGGREAEYA